MTNFQLLHQQDINKPGLSRFMHGVTGDIFEFIFPDYSENHPKKQSKFLYQLIPPFILKINTKTEI